MKFVNTLILVFLAYLTAFSQDSIYFLNGKIKRDIKIVQSDDITRIAFKKSGSESIKTVKKSDVFAIYRHGEEKIIYFQDTMQNNELSVEEMRKYVKGIQAARENFRSPFPFIGGVVTGAGGVAALNPFYGLTVPTLYTVLIGIKDPKPKKIDPYLEFDPFYIDGYQSFAKGRKIRQAIFGGILGAGTMAALGWLKVIK